MFDSMKRRAPESDEENEDNQDWDDEPQNNGAALTPARTRITSVSNVM